MKTIKLMLDMRLFKVKEPILTLANLFLNNIYIVILGYGND